MGRKKDKKRKKKNGKEKAKNAKRNFKHCIFFTKKNCRRKGAKTLPECSGCKHRHK